MANDTTLSQPIRMERWSNVVAGKRIETKQELKEGQLPKCA